MAKTIKIAYLISSYKLPKQTARLIRRLLHPDDIFLVHVDKKSPDDVIHIMQEELQDLPNVIFLSRHVCHHGDFGHVRATLKGMKYLVDHEVQFTNFVVLTGQDYPLGKLAQVRQKIVAAKNSMEYFKLPTQNWTEQGMNRLHRGHYWLRNRHLECKSPHFKMTANTVLRIISSDKAASFYGGSSYFQLEREAVLYVLKVVRSHPYLRVFFSQTYISDEIFFQTILLNSPLSDSIKNDSQRYVDWEDPHEVPKVMRLGDIKTLQKSSAIFARKFDTGIDEAPMDRLDALAGYTA